jgi:hypothetical protein
VTFWFGDKNKDEWWRAAGLIVVIPANLSKWAEALYGTMESKSSAAWDQTE